MINNNGRLFIDLSMVTRVPSSYMLFRFDNIKIELHMCYELFSSLAHLIRVVASMKAERGEEGGLVNDYICSQTILSGTHI